MSYQKTVENNPLFGVATLFAFMRLFLPRCYRATIALDQNFSHPEIIYIDMVLHLYPTYFRRLPRPTLTRDPLLSSITDRCISSYTYISSIVSFFPVRVSECQILPLGSEYSTRRCPNLGQTMGSDFKVPLGRGKNCTILLWNHGAWLEAPSTQWKC